LPTGSPRLLHGPISYHSAVFSLGRTPMLYHGSALGLSGFHIPSIPSKKRSYWLLTTFSSNSEVTFGFPICQIISGTFCPDPRTFTISSIEITSFQEGGRALVLHKPYKRCVLIQRKPRRTSRTSAGTEEALKLGNVSTPDSMANRLKIKL
jgi:hypothetical protein